MGLNNFENVFDTAAVKLESSKLKQQPPSAFPETMATGNLKASSWEIVERAGVPILTRRYPLTMQGEELGHFEVSFACGRKDHRVAYKETRRTTENAAVHLIGVGLGVGNTKTEVHAGPLAIGSSSRNMQDATIESSASGTVAPAFVTELMRDGGQPLWVATVDSKKEKTNIKIGNAGLSASFDQFMAKCKD